MPRTRSWIMLAITFSVIVVFVTHTPVSIAQSVCGEWTVVSTPNPGSGNRGLTGLAVVSPADVYALGSSGVGPFLIYWDGTGWSEIPLPDIGNPYSLRSIGVAGQRVWVAGFMSTGPWSTSQVFFGWDGSTWDVVDVFDLIPQTDGSTRGGSPTAISGTSENDVWTVGDGNTLLGSNSGALLTIHWNGSESEEILTQSVGDRHNHLRGVASIGENDALAVGYYSEPLTNILHALIIRWDGNTWNRVDQPAESLDMTLLKDIDVLAPDDIWVVGDNFGDPLFMHYDGSGWSIIPGPPVPISLSVGKVAAVAPNDVWAVTHSTVGFFHWDGSVWSVVSAPDVPGATGTAFGGGLEAAGDCDVWAVGSWSDGSSNSTLAAHLEPPGSPTGIDPDLPAAASLRVRQNYPNPFSSTTQVRFDLAVATDVVVEVFDVRGRRLHVQRHPMLPAGPNTVQLTGAQWPTGLYYYRVVAGGESQSRKMVVIR